VARLCEPADVNTGESQGDCSAQRISSWAPCPSGIDRMFRLCYNAFVRCEGQADTVASSTGAGCRASRRVAPRPEKGHIGLLHQVVDSAPRVSQFYGIIIATHYSAHGAPHFHAGYAEHETAGEAGNTRGRGGGAGP